MRSPSAVSRRSSSCSASRRACPSSARSASAGPRQSASRAAQQLGGRCRVGRPASLLDQSVERLQVGVAGREPQHVAGRLREQGPAWESSPADPSARRRPETYPWTSLAALPGGRSPQSSSTRWSTPTTVFARSSSTPSRARCLLPPRATTRSPSRTSSGPNMRNSIRLLPGVADASTVSRRMRGRASTGSRPSLDRRLNRRGSAWVVEASEGRRDAVSRSGNASATRRRASGQAAAGGGNATSPSRPRSGADDVPADRRSCPGDGGELVPATSPWAPACGTGGLGRQW